MRKGIYFFLSHNSCNKMGNTTLYARDEPPASPRFDDENGGIPVASQMLRAHIFAHPLEYFLHLHSVAGTKQTPSLNEALDELVLTSIVKEPPANTSHPTWRSTHTPNNSADMEASLNAATMTNLDVIFKRMRSTSFEKGWGGKGNVGGDDHGGDDNTETNTGEEEDDDPALAPMSPEKIGAESIKHARKGKVSLKRMNDETKSRI